MSCARLTELTLDEDFDGAVSVTHARSLGEALALISSAPAHDVVVADLGLPDAHGAEIITRLRAASSPPIVVLSGLDTPGIEATLQAAGAASHVLKGHEHVVLAAAITAAMTAG
jgi:CheY-like chemotaxis protein